MTDRKTEETGPVDSALVWLIAVGGAALLVVRWLASLDWLGLAGVVAGLAALLFGWWAVWPKRRLPRHRVRYMRLRARLRLHPGPGHATVFELWLRWGRLAAARRAKRSRPSLPLAARLSRPSQTSVLVGRATTGTGCGSRWKSTSSTSRRPARASPGRWPASSPATRARWWRPRPAGTCTR